MAFVAATVPPMPDKICLGTVKAVGDAYLSEKQVYHVMRIDVKAQYAGADGTFFLCFQPRWFMPGFDPASLLKEDGGNKVYGMYRRTLADVKKTTVLQALATNSEKPNGFTTLDHAFDNLTDPDPQTISQIIREHILGNEVCYVVKQRKDESGELMDAYNISEFIPALPSIIQQTVSRPRRDGSKLVVTWPEE